MSSLAVPRGTPIQKSDAREMKELSRNHAFQGTRMESDSSQECVIKVGLGNETEQSSKDTGEDICDPIEREETWRTLNITAFLSRTYEMVPLKTILKS